MVHYTDRVLFDEVWERDGFSKQDHSLISVAEDELKEAILQLAFYTGWPNGMAAMNVAQKISTLDQEDSECLEQSSTPRATCASRSASTR